MMLFEHTDCLLHKEMVRTVARQQLNGSYLGILTEINFFFSVFCVIYTKTIIYFNVSEYGGYLPCCLELHLTSTTIQLHFNE